MLEQIDQPLLVDHFHSQLASLIQLRSRLFAGDYEAGFLAHRRADLSASCFNSLPRFLAAQPRKRPGEDKGEPRQGTGRTASHSVFELQAGGSQPFHEIVVPGFAEELVDTL